MKKKTFNICYEKTHGCSQKIWLNFRFFYRTIVFKIPFKKKKKLYFEKYYEDQVIFFYILQVKINASVIQPFMIV
jgi:hypothetical protein